MHQAQLSITHWLLFMETNNYSLNRSKVRIPLLIRLEVTLINWMHLQDTFFFYNFFDLTLLRQEKEIIFRISISNELANKKKYFKMADIKKEIDLMNPKKYPGYDLITAKVLKQLNYPLIRLISLFYTLVYSLIHGHWQ